MTQKIIRSTSGAIGQIINLIVIRKCIDAGKLKKIVDADTKYTLETTKKRDLISDQEIDVIKIVAPDPLSIGGTDYSIREKIISWSLQQKITKIIYTILH